jgi:hypothetical protein
MKLPSIAAILPIGTINLPTIVLKLLCYLFLIKFPTDVPKSPTDENLPTLRNDDSPHRVWGLPIAEAHGRLDYRRTSPMISVLDRGCHTGVPKRLFRLSQGLLWISGESSTIVGADGDSLSEHQLG